MSDQSYWSSSQIDPGAIPFRNKFDAARDPLTARNALGITPVAIGAQPLDGDLTAIAALTGTNTIYYRSAANTWTPVTIGGNLTFSSGVLNSVTVAAPQGRLTLATATPVMTTTQSAKTTIFYTPYLGAQLPIFDGSTMNMTTFSELSVATTDTTKSPAAIGADKINDWFVWNDSGTIRIGHGPDWTSDTVRSAGTALTMVNGIYLNNASITNGPAASRGTYVGTTRSNASSQLDWIFGATAANGTAARFGVWNANNRVRVGTTIADSTDSWTYTTASWRAANNSATMRASFITGLTEDNIQAIYSMQATGTGGVNAAIGLGLDSTTAFSGTTGIAGGSTFNGNLVAIYNNMHGGWHFISAIEYASGATATFYGDVGLAYEQTGLHVSLVA